VFVRWGWSSKASPDALARRALEVALSGISAAFLLGGSDWRTAQNILTRTLDARILVSSLSTRGEYGGDEFNSASKAIVQAALVLGDAGHASAAGKTLE
jgi:hypothetical protein